MSILIPTLDSRQTYFNHISSKLAGQIQENDLQDQVEILHYPDNGGLSTGYKRNVLLQKAKGRFEVCVDDDDDVSEHYVIAIVGAIKLYDKDDSLDAIGIRGIWTENGSKATQFETALKHKWETTNGIFYRYCNHISPIKTKYAKQFKFPDKYIGEDYDWTMQLRNSGLLKKDFVIPNNLYFYRFRTNK